MTGRGNSEHLWQINLTQIGAVSAVLCLALGALALRPVVAASDGDTGNREDLRVPDLKAAPDLDKALKRLVEDSFTRGRSNGRIEAAGEKSDVEIDPGKIAISKLTPPPRPLAINRERGLISAYYPSGDRSGKLVAKYRGENIGRWTIIEISNSFVRYRHDREEIKHNLFGGDDD